MWTAGWWLQTRRSERSRRLSLSSAWLTPNCGDFIVCVHSGTADGDRGIVAELPGAVSPRKRTDMFMGRWIAIDEQAQTAAFERRFSLLGCVGARDLNRWPKARAVGCVGGLGLSDSTGSRSRERERESGSRGWGERVAHSHSAQASSSWPATSSRRVSSATSS